jgi:hypothetical protein
VGHHVNLSFAARKPALCHVPEANDFGTLQTGPVRFPVSPDCKVIPDGPLRDQDDPV